MRWLLYSITFVPEQVTSRIALMNFVLSEGNGDLAEKELSKIKMYNGNSKLPFDKILTKQQIQNYRSLINERT